MTSPALKKVIHETSKVEKSKMLDETYGYFPEPDLLYAPYGNFATVLQVVRSGQFFPLWITGLSGNGKTQMIEQACALAGVDDAYLNLELPFHDRIPLTTSKKAIDGRREFIRVNFTNETDENDLIGGFRLINGNTVFHEGPVTAALRRGAILLLDEVDAGHTNKILCLQSVLEGRGVLVKATGEFVKPAPGFNVFATSNTKGRGSDDGKFIGTNIMNGAFMDRFAGIVEQTYPPADIEKFILVAYYTVENFAEKDSTDEDKKRCDQLCSKLVKWAKQTRDTNAAGALDEVITTRALLKIIKGTAILGDEMQAIKLICQRYDEATSSAFLDFYNKL